MDEVLTTPSVLSFCHGFVPFPLIKKVECFQKDMNCKYFRMYPLCTLFNSVFLWIRLWTEPTLLQSQNLVMYRWHFSEVTFSTFGTVRNRDMSVEHQTTPVSELICPFMDTTFWEDCVSICNLDYAIKHLLDSLSHMLDTEYQHTPRWRNV
jgi:hypothetical protein